MSAEVEEEIKDNYAIYIRKHIYIYICTITI